MGSLQIFLTQRFYIRPILAFYAPKNLSLPERRLACAFLCKLNFVVPGSKRFFGRNVFSLLNTDFKFKALRDILAETNGTVKPEA